MLDRFPNAKLVKETRWSRTYQVEPNFFAYESKFKTDGLSISVEELSSKWASWAESEKLDFAKAFKRKPEITHSDEKVLEFLMAEGDEVVWSTIALCLIRHSNKGMVLDFLLERLKGGLEPKSNFIQALYVLGDRAAVSKLREFHDRLSEEIKAKQSHVDRWTVYDFLRCCEALVYLEGTELYREEIRSFLDHHDEEIGNRAQNALAGPQPEEFGV